MPDDEVEQAIALLETKRETIITKAMEQVAEIDSAIGILRHVLPASSPEMIGPKLAPVTVPTEPEPPLIVVGPAEPKRSVRKMVQVLLDESGHDWSVFEIVEEYKRRGNPIQVKNPENSVRAALQDAKEAGKVVRTNFGRYGSAEFDWPGADEEGRD